jgi:Xaa-Pro aminopeptidase
MSLIYPFSGPIFRSSCDDLSNDLFPGRCWQDKVDAVRKKLEDKECSMVVICALDEIAWLLNLRGSDINFNPVFYCYAIVTMDMV